MKLRVLFVDDEYLLLQGLRRAFLPFQQAWAVDFAHCGEAALRLMEAKKFDAVVSDLGMPGMDGAALLTQVRELHPESLRILLSGHWDPLAEVTSEWAHMSFSKPCSTDALRTALARPFELEREMADPELCHAIRGVASNFTARQMSDGLAVLLGPNPPPEPALPSRWSRLLVQSISLLRRVSPGFDDELEVCGAGAFQIGSGAKRALALVALELAREADVTEAARRCEAMLRESVATRKAARNERAEAALTGFLQSAGPLVRRAAGCREGTPGAPWTCAYLGALWGLPLLPVTLEPCREEWMEKTQ